MARACPLRAALRRLRLTALRLTGAAQRLAVILRYEGLGAAGRAIADRVRPARARRMDPAATLVVQSPTRASAEGAAAPMVSVIVRTFNRPGLLRQALTDLAAQTYAAFEVVVVDDGELPAGAVVAEFTGALQITSAPHVRGAGRSAALNSGLQAAKGEFITYLDDDDRVIPQHLARLVDGFQAGVDAVYTQAVRALCWSNLREDRVLERFDCVSRPYHQRVMLVDNWIPLMTLMHRAACIAQTGAFDPSLTLFEDWDFLIRLGARSRIVHAAVTTAEYRYRFGPIPNRARSALAARRSVLEATEAIYDRYPVHDAESHARRRLTLNALRRDIDEVAWIEATTPDPLLRDMRTVAWAGRFGDVSRYEAELRRMGLLERR